MSQDQENPLLDEQWIEKTNFPIGVDLTQPPPQMRYQLMGGKMYTLQLSPSGAITRGEIDPAHAGFQLQGEGWYNGQGEFLGDDPSIEDFE